MNIPKTVRFRTTAAASLALTVLVGLGAVLLQFVVAREIRAGLDQTLLSQASDRASLLDQGFPAENLTTPTGHEALVVVVDAEGNIIGSAGSAYPEEVRALEPGLSDQLVQLSNETHHNSSDGEAEDAEKLRTAVVLGQSGVKVIVAVEAEEQANTIAAIRAALLVGAVLMALLAAGITWLVMGQALLPVQKMRDDLDTIVAPGTQNSDARVQIPGTADEIEGLARGMNEVLQRLAQQRSVRRRFVSDASHELQSPIANAKILIETTAPSSDPAVVQTNLERVGTELDRLQSLVDDLLFLAKSDEGHATASRGHYTHIDIDDIVFDEAERLTIRSPHRVDAAGVQPAQVLGDGAHLSRAVRNLLENASRHAATTVRVAVELGETSCQIHVDDDGPGVAASERELIFERFGRSSSARARDGGTGLGLSIVASIAESHAGSVTVSDGPLGGARFTLSLPNS